jgi:hypothetical protein
VGAREKVLERTGRLGLFCGLGLPSLLNLWVIRSKYLGQSELERPGLQGPPCEPSNDWRRGRRKRRSTGGGGDGDEAEEAGAVLRRRHRSTRTLGSPSASFRMEDLPEVNPSSPLPLRWVGRFVGMETNPSS